MTSEHTFLYPNFVHDEAELLRCEQYWVEVVRHACEKLGQSDDHWRSWMARFTGDGTPVYRLDPEAYAMIERRSRDGSRGFRVQHHAPRGNFGTIAAWLDRCLPGSAGPEQELVISLSLTPATAELANRLLLKWMDPATTWDRMSQIIADLG